MMILCALNFSCTHLASVSTSQIPLDRSKSVAAEGYRFMFLFFNFNNNFVDDLVTDLAKQCPGGKVQGILTKQEDVTYFPLIAHAYRVTATGFCVGGQRVAASKGNQ